MSLLSPWSLLWLIAGATVVAIYFLKPRSRRVEVSSTWLWQGALQEESARSLIQWLKRHLLLLLQVLVALLAVFALARPALSRTLPVGRTVVLAIDSSAAMLANDGDAGILAQAGLSPASGSAVTRFDEAKARAVQVLNQLRPGDRAVILRAADRAEVVAQGTLPADAHTLRNAVVRLPVAPAELDVAQAMEVAGGLTRTARLGEILFITGGVAEVDQSTLNHRPPVAVQVGRVGRGDADNQAITALEARRDGTGELEVFARIRNFGDQPASGLLRIKVDGEPFEEQPVDLAAKQTQEFLLSEFPPKASIVEATFVRNDLLLLDNVASAAVSVAPVRKVLLVGGRSDQLERALRSVPGVELAKADPQTYAATAKNGFDVFVFEGWFPPTAPAGHWILVDPPAANNAVEVTGTLGRRTEAGREINDAQIARVLPSPILRGVDLAGVGVIEAKRVRLPDWAEEVVTTREAPLVMMGYPRPYRAVVFAFDLRATNLFGRIGFPVLVTNVVNWLTGDLPTGESATAFGGGNRFVPGDALLIQPLPRTTNVQIETPTKKHYRFDGNQSVRFVDTGLPGAYTVTQFAGNEEIAKRIYVASVLQQGREASLADLRPRDAISSLDSFGGAQPAAILLGPGKEQQHQDWWRLLGAAAFAGLLAEWWWFHQGSRSRHWSEGPG